MITDVHVYRYPIVSVCVYVCRCTQNPLGQYEIIPNLLWVSKPLIHALPIEIHNNQSWPCYLHVLLSRLLFLFALEGNQSIYTEGFVTVYILARYGMHEAFGKEHSMTMPMPGINPNIMIIHTWLNYTN